MPVGYTVNPAERRAVLSFSNPYTSDEWRDAMLAILRHPQLPGPFTLLVDRRHSAPPTMPFVREMVDFIESHAVRLSGVRAAIVAGDDAGFGMAGMIALRTEQSAPGFLIQAFRNAADAERWLDQA